VFKTYGFHFTFALTEIHTIFTLVGMLLMARAGLFDKKSLPNSSLMQLAAAYVGYIVLCNLSLKINTVGFYQVMKIAVAPTVMALDIIMYRRLPKPLVIASVLLVCFGIAIATVTDHQMITNVKGILLGSAATLVTALYQLWAGSKQKELRASSMQLLQAYTPHATVLLGVLVPLCEPMGWSSSSRTEETLLGYHYSWPALLAIIISAVLGLLVSLSTFLVIGATSSLTYNVVGHLKTVIILTGGCLFFGDSMPLKKFVGVCIAMCGIVWYTNLKLVQAESSHSTTGSEGQQLPPLLPTHQRSGGLDGLDLGSRSVFSSVGLQGLSQRSGHQQALGGQALGNQSSGGPNKDND
jgi:solute carrier family 35 protein E3